MNTMTHISKLTLLAAVIAMTGCAEDTNLDLDAATYEEVQHSMIWTMNAVRAHTYVPLDETTFYVVDEDEFVVETLAG